MTRSGDNRPQIEVSLKDKVRLASRPAHIRRCDRYPDSFSMNVHHTLKLLVPDVCKKYLAYASSDHIVVDNISRTVTKFFMKGYPTTWWEGLMKHSLLKYVMPPSLHREAMKLIIRPRTPDGPMCLGPLQAFALACVHIQLVVCHVDATPSSTHKAPSCYSAAFGTNVHLLSACSFWVTLNNILIQG